MLSKVHKVVQRKKPIIQEERNRAGSSFDLLIGILDSASVSMLCVSCCEHIRLDLLRYSASYFRTSCRCPRRAIAHAVAGDQGIRACTCNLPVAMRLWDQRMWFSNFSSIQCGPCRKHLLPNPEPAFRTPQTWSRKLSSPQVMVQAVPVQKVVEKQAEIHEFDKTGAPS